MPRFGLATSPFGKLEVAKDFADLRLPLLTACPSETTSSLLESKFRTMNTGKRYGIYVWLWTELS